MILGKPDPCPQASDAAVAGLAETPIAVIRYIERLENFCDYIADIRGEL